MARPRNNIAKLPLDIRERICELLDDGVEYEAIRSDATVAAACAAAGDLTLHGTTFLAYRNSPEFAEYCKRRREWQDDFDRRRLAAHLVRSNGAIANQADLAAYLVTARTLEMLDDNTCDLAPKDLAALARSVKSAADRQWEAERTDLQAKIAELSAKLVAATTGSKKIDGAVVAEQLDKVLGVR